LTKVQGIDVEAMIAKYKQDGESSKRVPGDTWSNNTHDFKMNPDGSIVQRKKSK